MCMECGAPDNECETRFNLLLAKEFEDAGYGTVHHLTVATYMLQHSSKLTREGWLYERELLREFLVEKKLPSLIREQNKDLVDDGKRKFKIKSRDGMPVIPHTDWSKTILDVRTENAEVYCEDVNAWARATLMDSKRISIR